MPYEFKATDKLHQLSQTYIELLTEQSVLKSKRRPTPNQQKKLQNINNQIDDIDDAIHEETVAIKSPDYNKMVGQLITNIMILPVPNHLHLREDINGIGYGFNEGIKTCHGVVLEYTPHYGFIGSDCFKLLINGQYIQAQFIPGKDVDIWQICFSYYRDCNLRDCMVNTPVAECPMPMQLIAQKHEKHKNDNDHLLNN